MLTKQGYDVACEALARIANDWTSTEDGASEGILLYGAPAAPMPPTAVGVGIGETSDGRPRIELRVVGQAESKKKIRAARGRANAMKLPTRVLSLFGLGVG